MKVIIDPRSNYAYGSFYVFGLWQLVGKHNVSYRLSPFKELPDLGNDMRFVCVVGEEQTNYFLHLNDSSSLHDKDYVWCDVYGCVNANYSRYPKEKYPKLVSLVPSFGIRINSKYQMFMQALKVFLLIPGTIISRKEYNKYSKQDECKPQANIRHHFGRYYKTWFNRLPILAYQNDTLSEDRYLFFLSTLWYNDELNNNDKKVNLRRAHFIRACKSVDQKSTISIQFEGGLIGDNSSSNELFADVLSMQRVAFPNWIEKTKRSALVFNTPAFWDCHGWKLGEYLALGKCIVSTRLSNDLPYPLEHGKNIHFVDDTEESMRETIEFILTHPEYRHKLEKGAKDYWEKYGTPEASLKLLGIDGINSIV